MKRLLFISVMTFCLGGCGYVMEREWRESIPRKRQAYFDQMGDQIPEAIKQCILEGQICTGMTVEQVLLTWPRHRYVTSTYWTQPYKHSSGRTELDLVSSGGGYYQDIYYYTLHFDENGKLSHWFKWNR